MQQLGFDMVYTDPNTHDLVPWAEPTESLIAEIAAAPWKVNDIETTGLNPASKEQNFTGKQLSRGINNRLRMRVLSVFYPKFVAGMVKPVLTLVGFDFDQMTQAQRKKVSAAAMNNVVFGHNVGFDAYWLGRESEWTASPTMLLDSMLIARVLCPEQPLLLARMCNDENEDAEFVAAATSAFMQGRSGWSLADLALTQLRIILDKDFQGPKNWCEPFLTQQAYDYATGDSRRTYSLLCKLMDISEDEDILARYKELAAGNPVLRMVQPQVWDIVGMRRKGMPWSESDADAFFESQSQKVVKLTAEILALEPMLEKFQHALQSMGEGISAELKQAVGDAFTRRGLVVETTDKTGAFKIGEKDLRRAKAQVNDEAKILFDAWVALNRAKKSASMAKDWTGFAYRSGDGRLHPNTGHGPVTGRLSSSEPNCQQAPRDQGFRSCVRAAEGYKIIASDYSALDMRVGAALAIRAQRHIFEAYMGDREVADDVKNAIVRVVEGLVTLDQARSEEQACVKMFKAWKDKREDVADAADARKRYWERYRNLQRGALMARFTRCYAEVRMRAAQAGTAEWGSLRDAFSIPGMDIHTWTALGMIGKDPAALFGGLDNDEVVVQLKKWKKELGDKRQTGKVGNLSLLYAMQTLGLVEAAAKNYNIHWTFEEADKIRMDWLATYVEIDLWHAWMELNPFEQVYVPDMDRGGKFVKKQVYKSYTLGDRLIYAFGLNAALSYEDQSTGADILGTVMDVLRREYPEIYECAVNQVHDEMVFEVPADVCDEYEKLITRIMNDSAEKFLMPFGVKGECSPAVGDVWIKD